MTDRDSLDEKTRKALEKALGSEFLAAFEALPPEWRAVLLQGIKPTPKKKVGRKKGSGQDYSAALARMAELQVDNPTLSDRDAARTAAKEIDRGSWEWLRHLYGPRKNELLLAERKRREPAPAPPARAVAQEKPTTLPAIRPMADLAALYQAQIDDTVKKMLAFGASGDFARVRANIDAYLKDLTKVAVTVQDAQRILESPLDQMRQAVIDSVNALIHHPVSTVTWHKLSEWDRLLVPSIPAGTDKNGS